ncbi:MAG: glycoside hydrolase, partial [Verrucomicrobiota bacterium]
MMKKTLKTLTTCLMAVVFLGLGSGISQTVNYLNTPLQSIDGFGACTAWYVKDTHGLSTTKQDQVFNALYSLKTGAGLSMLRMRIPFEFEQTAGTYTPSALANDVWFAQRAKGLGVSTVWATPWSPPAWMKTTNTVLGWSGSADGYLKTANYQDFANFLAQYWKEFKTQSGISLDYISVQNEPDYSPGSYEGCRYSTSNFHDFILKLGPTFASQGVATGIIMPETSTWNDYQTQTSLNDAATRNDISVIALHGYNHNPGAAGVLDGSIYGTNGQLKFAPTSGKPLWETEISRYNVAADPSITDGLVWALNVHDALTKANANAWHA